MTKHIQSVAMSNFTCQMSHPTLDIDVSEYVVSVEFQSTRVKIFMRTEIVDGAMRPYPSIKKAMNSAAPIEMNFTVEDREGKVVLRRVCKLSDIALSGLEDFNISSQLDCVLCMNAQMTEYKETFE